MFKWKKAAAALAAAAMTVAGAGCTVGSGSAYAMTIDGEQINAGIYIYYSYASYMELTQTLQSQNSELDVKDDNVVKEQKMDGVSSEEWIKNKALEYCQRYVAIEKKFDELDLSLTEEESKDVESTIDSFWDTNGEIYEKNGISKNSVKSVLENTYMTNEVFLYYYGVDGEEGTTEDDLKQYYEENNARVRYIKFDLTDGNGEALDDAGKKEMKAKVEDYLGEINALKGDEDAMEDEMDNVQSDYNAYVTSISEEAAAATATSATDADGNEIAGNRNDIAGQPRQVDTGTFRRQYGLDGEYLLYVGQVDEKKECPMLMRYFMEFQKRTGSKLKLVLAGKKICRIPEHPDILALGFLPENEKFSAIAGAKAVVIPSRQMGVSMTLLESMAMSVPVLVNGGSPVLQGHCKKSNGGLFYQSYFEFEGALQYLTQHPVEYMQLCANARAYITAYYDWESIMQRFQQIIEWVSPEKD